MLRRFGIAFAGALIGIFTIAGVAGAATPTPSPYPAPPAFAVAVNHHAVGVGATVDFSGTGFLPGEDLAITVSFPGPSGLRYSPALESAAVPASVVLDGLRPGAALENSAALGISRDLRISPAMVNLSGVVFGETIRADSSGGFSTPIALNQVGLATLTARGLTSGRVGSEGVQVGAAAGSGSTGSTDTDATTSSSEAAAGATETDSTTSGGLAYTGASIAGPLGIGAACLLVGLALLFFGTRLAIRRKHGSSLH